jgi:hypothetical protein
VAASGGKQIPRSFSPLAATNELGMLLYILLHIPFYTSLPVVEIFENIWRDDLDFD